MSVSVLIPYRPDGGHRDRIWEWLRRRYETLLPACEVVVSDDLHQTDYFNRGQARNLAAEKAAGDVYLLGDADTAFNPKALLDAIADCVAYDSWLVPNTYRQLSRKATEDVLAGSSSRLLTRDLAADWVGVGSSVAPIVVVPAVAFHAVGGYDERYPGWGSDDGSFQVAMDALYQPYRRWRGTAYHLWHPRTETHDSGAKLMLDYRAVEGDADGVRRLREGHLVR